MDFLSIIELNWNVILMLEKRATKSKMANNNSNAGYFVVFHIEAKSKWHRFFLFIFFTNIKFTNIVFQCYRIRLRLCWPSRRKMTVQAMNIYCPPSLTAPPPGWPGQCLCYWSRSAETWPCPWGFRAACLCPAAAPADSQSDTRRRRRRRRWWEGGGAEKVGKKRRMWTNGRVDELKCCLKMMA